MFKLVKIQEDSKLPNESDLNWLNHEDNQSKTKIIINKQNPPQNTDFNYPLPQLQQNKNLKFLQQHSLKNFTNFNFNINSFVLPPPTLKTINQITTQPFPPQNNTPFPPLLNQQQLNNSDSKKMTQKERLRKKRKMVNALYPRYHLTETDINTTKKVINDIIQASGLTKKEDIISLETIIRNAVGDGRTDISGTGIFTKLIEKNEEERRNKIKKLWCDNESLQNILRKKEKRRPHSYRLSNDGSTLLPARKRKRSNDDNRQKKKRRKLTNNVPPYPNDNSEPIFMSTFFPVTPLPLPIIPNLINEKEKDLYNCSVSFIDNTPITPLPLEYPQLNYHQEIPIPQQSTKNFDDDDFNLFDFDDDITSHPLIIPQDNTMQPKKSVIEQIRDTLEPIFGQTKEGNKKLRKFMNKVNKNKNLGSEEVCSTKTVKNYGLDLITRTKLNEIWKSDPEFNQQLTNTKQQIIDTRNIIKQSIPKYIPTKQESDLIDKITKNILTKSALTEEKRKYLKNQIANFIRMRIKHIGAGGMLKNLGLNPNIIDEIQNIWANKEFQEIMRKKRNANPSNYILTGNNIIERKKPKRKAKKKKIKSLNNPNHKNFSNSQGNVPIPQQSQNQNFGNFALNPNLKVPMGFVPSPSVLKVINKITTQPFNWNIQHHQQSGSSHLPNDNTPITPLPQDDPEYDPEFLSFLFGQPQEESTTTNNQKIENPPPYSPNFSFIQPQTIKKGEDYPSPNQNNISSKILTIIQLTPEQANRLQNTPPAERTGKKIPKQKKKTERKTQTIEPVQKPQFTL